MTNPTELLPCPKECPFCAGPAKVNFSQEIGRWDIYEVECPACDFSLDGPIGFEGDAAKRAAIEAWNTRAAPAPVASVEVEDAAVDRIRSIMKDQGDRVAKSAARLARAGLERDVDAATVTVGFLDLQHLLSLTTPARAVSREEVAQAIFDTTPDRFMRVEQCYPAADAIIALIGGE